MSQETRVVAVASSDWHLSHLPPVARSAEKYWYDVQEKYVKQVAEICNARDVPLLHAGDVFDDGWRPHRCPPELVNFAVHLFRMFRKGVYGVPGQHDLPNHSYDDIRKSAYWTLVEANVLNDIPKNIGLGITRDIMIHGCPWGFEPKPRETEKAKLDILVAHRYIWWSDNKYEGAPEDKNIYGIRKSIEGYDVSIFGDNHKGFLIQINGEPLVLNCGTLLRRHLDERYYLPNIGFIQNNGYVIQQPIHDTPHDRWADVKIKTLDGTPIDLAPVLESMERLTSGGLDFTEALLRAVNNSNISGAACEVIRQALPRRL